VRDDFGPGFFNLVLKSPLPRDFGAAGSDLRCRFLLEPHRHLERCHHHPNPPPHRCRATSVSPDSPVHAQRVTPSPLVLEAKTSPRLSPRITGGSRVALLTLGTMTAQCARHAGLGWLGHIDRGLGHPLAGRLGLFAHERGRPPTPGRCSFGPDRAMYYSSFFNFRIPLTLSIFQELVPISKIHRNLYKTQKKTR
jgi:hypothetical protein